ncbi:matrix metalloproteinase-20 [Salmo salar]|uniref:Matrix metalloproteinase-20 n=1 Tax=Salmo salar TaxID=8030 RepID=A0A1S3T1E3_SALSA|nr:matrix metalloproteinase-20 [Salmo salar]|eukprot:XP_014070397.1 PREDICTED: matrix metalloproteinase-20-like [Salmo salar]
MELAEGYLRRFYHMSPSSGPRPRNRRATATTALREKIREMQAFFSLKQTGILDLQTLSVMRKHRCGVPDVKNYSFNPDQIKWKNHTITYRIDQYTPDLTQEEVDTSFHLALKIWSDAAPLKFIKVNHDKADIILSFAKKTHGDFFPFDGPKGVLAHAFAPGEDMGGDVHFDEDEIWTMGHSKLGYNLFTVAAHELGHSLGLSHSKDPSSLMYPNYNYYNGAQYTLPRDDALGIQALYGKPVRKQDPPNLPKKCDPNFSVDAVAVFGKEIVFFKNRYMWLRTTWTTYWNRLREGPSSTYLPSINSPVDAAYDIPAKGVACVFTGPKYWVVRQLKMKSHFGSIYDYGFPARVRNIDTAVHISEYGKTFFFIGHDYYRYDEHRRRMDPGFPRDIQTSCPGIGRRVDAAFELQGTIYLFSGTKAYNYDYRRNRVLNRILANAWLGC